MRAFTQLWDRIGLERYGVTDPKARRFRYGVQVNSLGLTEAQPENNVQRIVLEMLGVTLSRDARARSIQLPAWNEALGLPRPWDQQWALRMQQVLAFETDLLEYPDLFEGSTVMESLTSELADGGVGRARGRAGAGRCLRGHRGAQGPARRQPRRADAADRVGRPHRGRRQPLHRGAALAARGRGLDPQGRPGAGGRDDRRARGVAGAARRGGGEALPRGAAPRGGHDREPPAGHHRPRPRRRHHRRVGRGAARGVRRVPRAHRRGGGRGRGRRQRGAARASPSG